MASFGIGAKLRQERLSKGLAIDDIARDTRIAPRFLEAIETDDYSGLPGLIFTRNFVRQYALTLQLDPEPLLAELPKQDESTARLPAPPARSRSSYQRDRALRSALSSVVWLLAAGGAGVAAYMHFNHSGHAVARQSKLQTDAEDVNPNTTVESPADARDAGSTAIEPPPAREVESITPIVQPTLTAAAVRVSVTAHESAWVQVSADGKTTFTGTLQPNETKEIAAAEQVKVLTGNAGALTISLNGKTLDSLGPVGQVRSVKLTAEGPQFLSKAPPPPPEPDQL